MQSFFETCPKECLTCVFHKLLEYKTTVYYSLVEREELGFKCSNNLGNMNNRNRVPYTNCPCKFTSSINKKLLEKHLEI